MPVEREVIGISMYSADWKRLDGLVEHNSTPGERPMTRSGMVRVLIRREHERVQRMRRQEGRK